RFEIDDAVVPILEQKREVLERRVNAGETLLRPFQERSERRLRDDRLGKADLQNDQERREEEQQQPDIRHHHRPAKPGAAVMPVVGDCVAHARSRIVLGTSQDRYTSSSHSTVSFAVRRRFCALTWMIAPLCKRTRYSDESPK